MQAIVTKFIGPTNHRGARVIATCEAGKLDVPWDYALSVEPNHHAAALALADKLGWNRDDYGQLVSGALPGAGYCHVFVKASRDLQEQRPGYFERSGRVIKRNGEPFVYVEKESNAAPTEADCAAVMLTNLLNSVDFAAEMRRYMEAP